jgi:DNA-directed RNA polymerase subunit RPC12/RpoP
MTQDTYRCEDCGATFDSQDELEEHDRVRHSRYICEVCGAIVTSERELEDHNRDLHPEVQRTPR